MFKIHHKWLLATALLLLLGGCRETAVTYEIRPLLKIPERLDTCCLTFINDGKYHSSFSVALGEEQSQGGPWTLSVVDGGHDLSEMEIRGYLRGLPVSWQRHSFSFTSNQILEGTLLTVPSSTVNRVPGPLPKGQYYVHGGLYLDTLARVAAVPSSTSNDRGLIFQDGKVSLAARLDRPLESEEIPTPQAPGLPLEIRVVDLDGDCLQDAVALYSGAVHIFRQDLAGGFHVSEVEQLSALGEAFVDMDLARLNDLDGDSKINDMYLELVLATRRGIHIFNGDGKGGFTTGSVVNLEGITAIEIGMINNDLHPDIVVARQGYPNVVVYRFDKGFTSKEIGEEESQSTDVVVGELFQPSGAADPYEAHQEFHEILFRNKDGSLTYYQNRAGQLAEEMASFPHATEVRRMLVQDLNGDGREDLVLVEEAHTRVFHNMGADGFSSEILAKSAGYSFSQVQVANIDSHYQRDLLLAGESGITGWQ